MGAYINPRGETKEQWLEREGLELPQDEVAAMGDKAFSGDWLPVCLVDNGPFTAACIMFDNRELDVWLRPDDTRPKRFFMAPLKLLYEVSNLKEYREPDKK
jgi:hypothetical protein